MKTLLVVANIPVVLNADSSLSWVAGLAIDADGAYRAYHPQNKKGLDDISCAGRPGNWWGIVTENGEPVVQGPNDPAPGYYVSPTTYQHRKTPEGKVLSLKNPLRYVDAESVPYVVVPPQIRLSVPGVVMGCHARVSCNGKVVDAVVADIGPRSKLGEGSMALAAALGFNPSPRHGGTTSKVVQYTIFPDVPARVNGVQYQLQPM